MAKQHRPAVNASTLTGFSRPAQASGPSYSGDKPNPELRHFVESKATPYDPTTDNYDVPAFNQPITTTKATAIYNMHSYHQGKKPHDAIRQYIRHYTHPGDMIMDPFCGSGATALAALMEGRKAIAIDRSPAATFITRNYCSPVDPEELRRALGSLKHLVQPEMDWLYETRCNRCDGKATTSYTVYSQVFQCPRCLHKVPLFDCIEAEGRTAAGKPKKIRVCPHCWANGHTEVIRSQSEKLGSVPVLVSYLCQNGCTPARDERRHNDATKKKREYFEKYDLGKLREIDSKEIPHRYPQGYDMSGFSRYQRDALFYYGVKEVADLFTKPNLWALAAIEDVGSRFDRRISEVINFAVTGICFGLSRMNQYRPQEFFPTSIMRGTFYIPQICHIRNAFQHYSNKFDDLIRGYGAILAEKIDGGDLSISTESSTSLDGIPSSSIDYIFTDPPYSDQVQYGELNFVWEAWLGFDTHWHEEEIIVNDVRGMSETDWASRMRLVMAECYRVLKPGRWLSLCYHDTSEGTWALVQDIMAEVGFVVDRTDSALFIDAGQKSYNQLTADKATKRDLVLNFRKPKVAFTHPVIRSVDGRTFSEVGRQVIRDYLTAHPGASKDRIYDELVSRLVHSGKMEAHDFNSLLRSVAEEVQEPIKKNLFENNEPDLFGSHVYSRWYLKETADEVVKAEQEKEDAAAARLEKHMAAHLRKHPEDEGVHYSDLFEHYLPVADKPRRLLADWLPEYCFKTAAGTWRPPANEQEREQKSALRQTGTLRRIKRFGNALIDGVPVRDKDRPGSDRTLADWIRQCRRAGLFEQGRALYEKGGLNLDRLGETEQIEVEDDYRICVRRGSAAEAKPKRQRRKADDA
jgi:DNA modification methylase